MLRLNKISIHLQEYISNFRLNVIYPILTACFFRVFKNFVNL